MENKKINIDNIDIQDVYEFMSTGDVKNAPEEIIYYLKMLDKVNGMQRRIRIYGSREMVLKHLILVDGLSRYKASVLYDETLEYFNRGVGVSKDTWRNIYAEKIDNLASAATILAKDVNDMYKVSSIITRAGDMRQLDIPEPPSFPKELLEKPIKVYAMDAEFLGEQKINRIDLARQIDELPEHSVNEKAALRMDAAIDQIILLPDEQKDIRKQK